MKGTIALLILFHLVAFAGATVGQQRKVERLRAETRWVHVEVPRWLNLPSTENIEDLRKP